MPGAGAAGDDLAAGSPPGSQQGGGSRSSFGGFFGGDGEKVLNNVFVLPLREQVVFPHQRFRISLGKAIFERVYRHCQEHNTQTVGLVCMYSKRHHLEDATQQPKRAAIVSAAADAPPGAASSLSKEQLQATSPPKMDLYAVGTLCELQSHTRGASGTTVSVQARQRFEIQSLRMYDYYGVATVRTVNEPPPSKLRTPEIRAVVEALHDVVKKLSESTSGDKRRVMQSLGEVLRSLINSVASAEAENGGGREQHQQGPLGGTLPPSRENGRGAGGSAGGSGSSFARSFENAFRRRVPAADELAGEEDDDAGYESQYAPPVLADMIAAHGHYRFTVGEQQTVLSEFDVKTRLETVLRVLTKLTKQQKISQEISSSMQTRSESEMKEAILRKQIGDLKKELRKVRGKKRARGVGAEEADEEDEDSDEDELQSIREKVAAASMTKAAEKIAWRELKRLNNMQSHHPEYTVCRTYLDLLCSLPWNKSSDDAVLDLANAAKILDEDHYGLDVVKKRVLEFLAVRKLRSGAFATGVPGPGGALVVPGGASSSTGGSSVSAAAPALVHGKNPAMASYRVLQHEHSASASKISPTTSSWSASSSRKKYLTNDPIAVNQINKTHMRGPILCLLGPPGVGKTSLGKSIAKAMGRQFQRIALGGVRDEAELRGHRRTYIGSMPGVIIQSLQTSGSNNPVILLDEIDKLAHGMTSNPQGCLLEILDQEQNHTFKDHYLNTPFDLSGVFFIATCNDVSTIDRPLLDRMEILELSGYSVEEKVFIAQRYLLPKQRKMHALEDASDEEGGAGGGSSIATGSGNSGNNVGVGNPNEAGDGIGAAARTASNGAAYSAKAVNSTCRHQHFPCECTFRIDLKTGSCDRVSPSGAERVEPASLFRLHGSGRCRDVDKRRIGCECELVFEQSEPDEQSAAKTRRTGGTGIVDPGAGGAGAVNSGGAGGAPPGNHPPSQTPPPPNSQAIVEVLPRGGGAAPGTAIKQSRRNPPRLEVTRPALVHLITKYTAESGVRSLERRVAEICRWVAFEIVEKGANAKPQYVVHPGDLFKICGMEVSRSEDLLAEALIPGVAVGLAVTHYGGELLFVEAAKVKGTGGLTITGQLGDVMKESVRASLSLLRPFVPEKFQQHDIHVHFPAGAVPKDGPSAGVATTLALASLFLERPCRNDTAVTGEITLRGQVLPVGGIKEKILAANRCPGIKYVLIPALNEVNVEQDLAKQVRSLNLQIVYVKTIRDALVHTFGVDNALQPAVGVIANGGVGSGGAGAQVVGSMHGQAGKLYRGPAKL
eukprot:g9195.t1